jgi:PTH1 family peptidyl-tRNA hydrolase
MWLIVGLGNPGSKYLFTRHNVGFMSADHFISGIGDLPGKDERGAWVTRFKMEEEELIFAKPMTFMNLSGEPVRQLMDFYKINLDHLIVVHDDIDQDFASIKIQKNRGHGGHNGIKSISQMMGSMDYLRLKLGVGRPANPQMDVASYVLQNFSAEEQAGLPAFLDRASDAIESLIFDGYDKAATKYNKSLADLAADAERAALKAEKKAQHEAAMAAQKKDK